MMRKAGTPGMALAVMLFSAVLATLCLPGCGGNGDGNGGAAVSEEVPQPESDVVITIGNLTDLTGPSATGMSLSDMSLDDLVRYYNEEDLIPGVELKVIKYDGQFDPAQDIPGYEWLREKGADLIFTAVPGSSTTLKSRVNQDGMVLFSGSMELSQLNPPGNVFCVGIIPELEATTFLKWIAENDWDYQAKGPAKVGGAGWDDGFTPKFLSAMQGYCRAHPDQFEWGGGHLTDFGFTWGSEAQALKDADYVFPPALITTFAGAYRQAGGRGQLIGSDIHLAFMEMIRDADAWDDVDGMLVMRSSRWWNEEGTLIDLVKKVLHRYHPDGAQEIIDRGSGYLGIVNAYQILEAVRRAVATVGPQNFDSEALYEATQSLRVSIDGVERYSFGWAKRASTNVYAMYRINAPDQDLVRRDPDWFLAFYGP